MQAPASPQKFGKNGCLKYFRWKERGYKAHADNLCHGYQELQANDSKDIICK